MYFWNIKIFLLLLMKLKHFFVNINDKHTEGTENIPNMM